MERAKLLKTSFGVVCAALLVFLVVNGTIIDRKLEQIARPSRLFNLQLIESQLPARPEWEAKLSPDHDRFFYVVSQQALSWVGRGANAFVFATGDGKYVVKFLPAGKMPAAESRGLFQKLFGGKPKSRKALQKLDEACVSSRICFDELRDETGLVYVHLNRTKAQIHGLKLADSFGQSQRVCGDDTCFVAQKKAQLLIPTLTHLMDRGDIEGAQSRIDQVFALLTALARKGYVDGDENLIANNNIGFLEDRAIYLDTFHFFRVKHLDILERMRYECQQRLLPLEKWIAATYPELSAYYSQKRSDTLMLLASEKKAAAPAC
jgi:hypothetical protein